MKKQGKLLGSLLKTTFPTLLTTDSGIIVGKGHGFSWPMHRLLPTVGKIARLLYFHELKKPVPPNHQVVSFGIDPSGSPEERELERRACAIDLAQDCRPGVTEDPSIFSYRWGVAEENPDYAVVTQMFMERVVFITFITPEDRELDQIGIPSSGP